MGTANDMYASNTMSGHSGAQHESEQGLKILKIQRALSVMFSNVNESGTDMIGSTNGALSRS